MERRECGDSGVGEAAEVQAGRRRDEGGRGITPPSDWSCEQMSVQSAQPLQADRGSSPSGRSRAGVRMVTPGGGSARTPTPVRAE